MNAESNIIIKQKSNFINISQPEEELENVFFTSTKAFGINSEKELLEWGLIKDSISKTTKINLNPKYLFYSLKISQIFSNNKVNIALDISGGVLSWGENADGLLGQGHGIAKSSEPVLLKHFDNPIIKISLSNNHCLALDCKGLVYSWGTGKYGELCLNQRIYSPNPTKIETSLMKTYNHQYNVNSSNILNNLNNDYIENEENMIYYTYISCNNYISCLIDSSGKFSYYGIIININDEMSELQILKLIQLKLNSLSLNNNLSTYLANNNTSTNLTNMTSIINESIFLNENSNNNMINSNSNSNIFSEKSILELREEPIKSCEVGNGFIALLSFRGIVFVLDDQDVLTLLFSQNYVDSISVGNSFIVGVSIEDNSSSLRNCFDTNIDIEERVQTCMNNSIRHEYKDNITNINNKSCIFKSNFNNNTTSSYIQDNKQLFSVSEKRYFNLWLRKVDNSKTTIETNTINTNTTNKDLHSSITTPSTTNNYNVFDFTKTNTSTLQVFNHFNNKHVWVNYLFKISPYLSNTKTNANTFNSLFPYSNINLTKIEMLNKNKDLIIRSNEFWYNLFNKYLTVSALSKNKHIIVFEINMNLEIKDKLVNQELCEDIIQNKDNNVLNEEQLNYSSLHSSQRKSSDSDIKEYYTNTQYTNITSHVKIDSRNKNLNKSHNFNISKEKSFNYLLDNKLKHNKANSNSNIISNSNVNVVGVNTSGLYIPTQNTYQTHHTQSSMVNIPLNNQTAIIQSNSGMFHNFNIKKQYQLIQKASKRLETNENNNITYSNNNNNTEDLDFYVSKINEYNYFPKITLVGKFDNSFNIQYQKNSKEVNLLSIKNLEVKRKKNKDSLGLLNNHNNGNYGNDNVSNINVEKSNKRLIKFKSFDYNQIQVSSNTSRNNNYNYNDNLNNNSKNGLTRIKSDSNIMNCTILPNKKTLLNMNYKKMNSGNFNIHNNTDLTTNLNGNDFGNNSIISDFECSLLVNLGETERDKHNSITNNENNKENDNSDKKGKEDNKDSSNDNEGIINEGNDYNIIISTYSDNKNLNSNIDIIDNEVINNKESENERIINNKDFICVVENSLSQDTLNKERSLNFNNSLNQETANVNYVKPKSKAKAFNVKHTNTNKEFHIKDKLSLVSFNEDKKSYNTNINDIDTISNSNCQLNLNNPFQSIEENLETPIFDTIDTYDKAGLRKININSSNSNNFNSLQNESMKNPSPMQNKNSNSLYINRNYQDDYDAVRNSKRIPSNNSCDINYNKSPEPKKKLGLNSIVEENNYNSSEKLEIRDVNKVKNYNYISNKEFSVKLPQTHESSTSYFSFSKNNLKETNKAIYSGIKENLNKKNFVSNNSDLENNNMDSSSYNSSQINNFSTHFSKAKLNTSKNINKEEPRNTISKQTYIRNNNDGIILSNSNSMIKENTSDNKPKNRKSSVNNRYDSLNTENNNSKQEHKQSNDCSEKERSHKANNKFNSSFNLVNNKDYQASDSFSIKNTSNNTSISNNQKSILKNKENTKDSFVTNTEVSNDIRNIKLLNKRATENNRSDTYNTVKPKSNNKDIDRNNNIVSSSSSNLLDKKIKESYSISTQMKKDSESSNTAIGAQTTKHLKFKNELSNQLINYSNNKYLSNLKASINRVTEDSFAIEEEEDCRNSNNSPFVLTLEHKLFFKTLSKIIFLNQKYSIVSDFLFFFNKIKLTSKLNSLISIITKNEDSLNSKKLQLFFRKWVELNTIADGFYYLNTYVYSNIKEKFDVAIHRLKLKALKMKVVRAFSSRILSIIINSDKRFGFRYLLQYSKLMIKMPIIIKFIQSIMSVLVFPIQFHINTQNNINECLELEKYNSGNSNNNFSLINNNFTNNTFGIIPSNNYKSDEDHSNKSSDKVLNSSSKFTIFNFHNQKYMKTYFFKSFRSYSLIKKLFLTNINEIVNIVEEKMTLIKKDTLLFLIKRDKINCFFDKVLVKNEIKQKRFLRKMFLKFSKYVSLLDYTTIAYNTNYRSNLKTEKNEINNFKDIVIDSNNANAQLLNLDNSLINELNARKLSNQVYFKKPSISKNNAMINKKKYVLNKSKDTVRDQFSLEFSETFGKQLSSRNMFNKNPKSSKIDQNIVDFPTSLIKDKDNCQYSNHQYNNVFKNKLNLFISILEITLKSKWFNFVVFGDKENSASYIDKSNLKTKESEVKYNTNNVHNSKNVVFHSKNNNMDNSISQDNQEKHIKVYSKAIITARFKNNSSNISITNPYNQVRITEVENTHNNKLNVFNNSKVNESEVEGILNKSDIAVSPINFAQDFINFKRNSIKQDNFDSIDLVSNNNKNINTISSNLKLSKLNLKNINNDKSNKLGIFTRISDSSNIIRKSQLTQYNKNSNLNRHSINSNSNTNRHNNTNSNYNQNQVYINSTKLLKKQNTTFSRNTLYLEHYNNNNNNLLDNISDKSISNNKNWTSFNNDEYLKEFKDILGNNSNNFNNLDNLSKSQFKLSTNNSISLINPNKINSTYFYKNNTNNVNNVNNANTNNDRLNINDASSKNYNRISNQSNNIIEDIVSKEDPTKVHNLHESNINSNMKNNEYNNVDNEDKLKQIDSYNKSYNKYSDNKYISNNNEKAGYLNNKSSGNSLQLNSEYYHTNNNIKSKNKDFLSLNLNNMQWTSNSPSFYNNNIDDLKANMQGNGYSNNKYSNAIFANAEISSVNYNDNNYNNFASTTPSNIDNFEFFNNDGYNINTITNSSSNNTNKKVSNRNSIKTSTVNSAKAFNTITNDYRIEDLEMHIRNNNKAFTIKDLCTKEINNVLKSNFINNNDTKNTIKEENSNQNSNHNENNDSSKLAKTNVISDYTNYKNKLHLEKIYNNTNNTKYREPRTPTLNNTSSKFTNTISKEKDTINRVEEADNITTKHKLNKPNIKSVFNLSNLNKSYNNNNNIQGKINERNNLLNKFNNMQFTNSSNQSSRRSSRINQKSNKEDIYYTNNNNFGVLENILLDSKNSFNSILKKSCSSGRINYSERNNPTNHISNIKMKGRVDNLRKLKMQFDEKVNLNNMHKIMNSKRNNTNKESSLNFDNNKNSYSNNRVHTNRVLKSYNLNNDEFSNRINNTLSRSKSNNKLNKFTEDNLSSSRKNTDSRQNQLVNDISSIYNLSNRNPNNLDMILANIQSQITEIKHDFKNFYSSSFYGNNENELDCENECNNNKLSQSTNFNNNYNNKSHLFPNIGFRHSCSRSNTDNFNNTCVSNFQHKNTLSNYSNNMNNNQDLSMISNDQLLSLNNKLIQCYRKFFDRLAKSIIKSTLKIPFALIRKNQLRNSYFALKTLNKVFMRRKFFYYLKFWEKSKYYSLLN